MKAEDADFAQHDLVDAIDNGNFPKWTMFIQTMTEEQARDFRWNPFDLTEGWSHAKFPMQEVGVMELNAISENCHAHMEQAAFAPAHVVNGIGYSPDKMLHGRILSYPDAQRYRLGVNYEHLPVNACPFGFSNYQRNGQMALGNNGGAGPNYFPNSFDGPVEDKTQGEPAQQLDGFAARYDRNEGPGNGDHYTQRQLCHWFRADIRLGMAVARGFLVFFSGCLDPVAGNTENGRFCRTFVLLCHFIFSPPSRPCWPATCCKPPPIRPPKSATCCWTVAGWACPPGPYSSPCAAPATTATATCPTSMPRACGYSSLKKALRCPAAWRFTPKPAY